MFSLRASCKGCSGFFKSFQSGLVIKALAWGSYVTTVSVVKFRALRCISLCRNVREELSSSVCLRQQAECKGEELKVLKDLKQEP